MLINPVIQRAALISNASQSLELITKLCVSFLLLILLNSNLYAADLGGTWQASYGSMYFPKNSGSQVSGTYDSESAQIIGTLEGTRLTGVWVRQQSEGSCESTVLGTNNWGQIVFEFNEDFTAFSGIWDYCDKTPTSGDWQGKKLCNATTAPTKTWSTSYGDMTFPDAPSSHITAPYEYRSNSHIIGDLAGQVLTGKWVEPDGDTSYCEEPYEGSSYWGAIKYEFDRNFVNFSGTWGYCEEEPDKSWNGNKTCEPQDGEVLPTKITNVSIVSSEPPYGPVENLAIDETFRVKVEFNKNPGRDSEEVTITTSSDAQPLQVEALRTDEPTVFRTEPVLIKPMVQP